MAWGRGRMVLTILCTAHSTARASPGAPQAPWAAAGPAAGRIPTLRLLDAMATIQVVSVCWRSERICWIPVPFVTGCFNARVGQVRRASEAVRLFIYGAAPKKNPPSYGTLVAQEWTPLYGD